MNLGDFTDSGFKYIHARSTTKYSTVDVKNTQKASMAPSSENHHIFRYSKFMPFIGTRAMRLNTSCMAIQ